MDIRNVQSSGKWVQGGTYTFEVRIYGLGGFLPYNYMWWWVVSLQGDPIDPTKVFFRNSNSDLSGVSGDIRVLSVVPVDGEWQKYTVKVSDKAIIGNYYLKTKTDSGTAKFEA